MTGLNIKNILSRKSLVKFKVTAGAATLECFHTKMQTARRIKRFVGAHASYVKALGHVCRQSPGIICI